MNRYGKCVLTGAVLLAGYALLLWAMGMMNRPSDLSLYAGLTLSLGLLVALPWLLWTIWRRRI
jgi:hypothetical protein